MLMIVDENYVKRADDLPRSGVGIENQWIKGVFQNKPVSWLSVLFVSNPRRRLPAWLAVQNPKGFDFNASPARNDFPGIEQMDDLWRWVEGLPADKAHALAPEVLLDRLARIERIDAIRDPANYANPALKDRVTFRHKDHPYYKLGHGQYEFKVNFSGHRSNSVYVYIDSGLKAVGLVTASDFDPSTVEKFLGPGRTVTPVVGQSVVMMNFVGALCVMKIESVQHEENGVTYVHPEVTFSYKILTWR
ncbi:hypothetical protein [Caballeronia sp. LZ019]|uniref:hypothetical protein n=1 Tax=Caballeronia sp. LZ019 TaxID=3038555 RepID=UPI0028618111|nr:hypothetical protein [Caballeronia sp. LZ019]MDR5809265.1 hypothetical protein [Caballeronia sp. LZ019]